MLSALALAVLVVVAYFKVFDNEFVDWDDFTYVINNGLVRNHESTDVRDVFRNAVSSNYHPLTVLSMRLNGNVCSWCTNGISAGPFIAWNVILHAVNSILVLLLAWKLSERNLLVSAFTAAVFAVHPMHVESVAWISARKDVLYSFFFLSGLLAYLRYREAEKPGWLVLTFICFVFSCLSKAVAVIFPLVLLTLDYWSGRKGSNRPFFGTLKELLTPRRILFLLPFLLVSVLAGMLAYRIQDGKNFLGILETGKGLPDVVNSAGPFSLWEKFRNGSYAFTAYLVKFFFPFRLSAFYPYPGSAEFSSSFFSFLLKISPAAFAAIIAAVVLSMRKTRLYAFGIGFFLVTIILVLQFIPVGYAIIAERYTYLPYIGLAFIAGTIVSQKLGRKPAAWLVAGGFVILLIVFSIRQSDTWHDTETLWSNTIEKFPDAEVARRSRGKLYSKRALQSRDQAERNRYEKLAIEDFSSAIRAGSRNAEVYEGMGVILGNGNDYQSSIKYLDAALRIDPENGSIYYNRALTLAKAGKPEEALADYTQALRHSPEKAVMIRTNRSNLLLSMRRFSEAKDDLDFLISSGKTDFNNYYNRAVARQLTGDPAGALDDYRKALEINPRDEEARKQMEDLVRLTR